MCQQGSNRKQVVSSNKETLRRLFIKDLIITWVWEGSHNDKPSLPGAADKNLRCPVKVEFQINIQQRLQVF